MMRLAGVALAVMLVLLLLPPHVYAAGWYNTGGTWNYRKAITIDHARNRSRTCTNPHPSRRSGI